MKIIKVENKKDKKKFIHFYKSQYLNSPEKRDSLSGIVGKLISGRSKISGAAYLEPLMVVEKEKLIMVCILAYAHRLPDFLQISFFESWEYSPDGFKLILNRAMELALEYGASSISASLNIHVNYGLGFLASDYEKKQSFGMAHNPEFYHKYFENSGFQSIEMITYKKDLRNIKNLLEDNIRKKINKKYSVRKINFKDFKNEINLYTEINNKTFKDHLFYYPRDLEEDMELFKDLKFLLREENFLFVEREGVPVGFMLWYPDFHEIMEKGETIGLSTVIKNKLFPGKISTFKIVEIGIIPSEQSKGAILALFDYCFHCAKGKYNNFESSWILKDNIKSKSFGEKWADGESKKYRAYIKKVD